MTSLAPRIRLRWLALVVSFGVGVGSAWSLPEPIQIAGKEAYPLTFAELSSFPYVVVDLGTGASLAEIEAAKQRDQVPAPVRAFAGKRVALTGYVMPLKLEDGKMTELILMKDVTTCCYGAVPQMNDYAVVSLKTKPIEPILDIPVVLVGVLSIGERYDEGYLVSLLRVEGEVLIPPET